MLTTKTSKYPGPHDSFAIKPLARDLNHFREVAQAVKDDRGLRRVKRLYTKEFEKNRRFSLIRAQRRSQTIDS